MGGYHVQGKQGPDAIRLLEEALQLQEAGCFALVLEGIPADLAARVTQELKIPTIGIGAGPHCAGQVFVFHDVLGMLPGHSPKFVRKYLDGYELMRRAIVAWTKDVQDGSFPGTSESYMLPDAARTLLSQWRPSTDSKERGSRS
jgi:3-methyl-2-oxobutanoate hydroxymethyltransferase